MVWNSCSGTTFHIFLDYDLHHVLHQKPEIFYFELGGTELDSSMDPDYLVHLVWNTAESLLHNNVKLIIFGEVFDTQQDKIFHLMNIISSFSILTMY